MGWNQEQELEESLNFMREQFRPLTQSIPIPDSLRADVLRARLELMEQEPAQKPDGRLLQFPMQRIMTVAACLVVAVGSLVVYNQNKSSLLQAPDAAPQMAMANEVSPSSPAAVSEDIAEHQPEMALGAPTPEAMLYSEGEMGSDSENDAMASPKMRGMPMPEDGDTGGVSGKVAPISETDLASMDEAYAVEKLGAYLPTRLPQGMVFSSGFSDNGQMFVMLSSSDSTEREIWITVSPMLPELQEYIVNPADPKTYDMRLYPMPWADSIPDELWWVSSNAIFREQELTAELVEARHVASTEANDQKTMGQFGVLCDENMLVQFNFVNFTAEEMYQATLKG